MNTGFLNAELAANNDAIMAIFQGVSMFKRGFRVWNPIIPKHEVRAFLENPKGFTASGSQWVDEAISIAKMICSVAAVICPIVNGQVSNDQ